METPVKHGPSNVTSTFDKDLPLLGKWLPDKVVFMDNLPSLKAAALMILLMLIIDATITPLIVKVSSVPLFYIFASLKYFLEGAFLIYIVFKIERRSLGSLGLLETSDKIIPFTGES